MILNTTSTWLMQAGSLLVPLLEESQPGHEAGAAGGHGTGGSTMIEPSPIEPILFFIVGISLALVIIGMVLCLYRLLRGPHLADRVLASDVLSMHVVGLVILLTIRLRTPAFFDAALVVAIMGFASTLAFAQYIGARRSESP